MRAAFSGGETAVRAALAAALVLLGAGAARGETRADGERADGERADEERADEERADGERADGERADEERAASPDGAPPLGERLGAPEWLELGLEHRSRIELREDANPNPEVPQDQIGYAVRTLLRLGVRGGPVRVSAELLDSRMLLEDPSRSDTSLENPLDLLSAFVELRAEELLAVGDELRLRVGRQTLDLGSRRLMARNRYRNTINAFGGVTARYRRKAFTATGLWLVPVERRAPGIFPPDGEDDYLDREDFRRHLGAGYLELHPPGWELELELYLFGQHDDRPGRIRTLFTPGARLLRAPARGRLDLEVELALQRGGAPADGDRPVRTHQAHFVHVDVGYTVDHSLALRLELGADVATGPSDAPGRSTRFDTLFGARRFDFGPTGVLGVLARADLWSPFLRYRLRPREDLRIDGQARLVWTERPFEGDRSWSGGLAEVRVRWSPWGPLVRLEAGLAGARLDGALGLTSTLYGYSQVSLRL